MDQANWRFLDKTDGGDLYQPATMYLAITKLEERTNQDGTK